MKLLDELEQRVVSGDGALGTLLLESGVPIERCFEELCLSEPERILKIHQDYIAAGARLIRTNTFGANAVRLGRFGMERRVREINLAAGEVARSATKERDVCVAGSVGPLGISGDEATRRDLDRAGCFGDQITALLDAGVDMIFFETFTDVEEMEIALRAKSGVGDIPAVCSFACAPDGILRCGMMLNEAFTKLRDLGARMMGVNCLNDPREMASLLRQLPAGFPLAVYPNAGQPQRRDGHIHYGVAPESFANAAGELIDHGARLLGGCCGTGPAHVAALARTLATLS